MAKGGNAEREIASLLSIWWGGKDDIFYRTNASGARFTQRKKSGKDTCGQGGDICCQDPIGQQLIDNWSIECKSGYGRKKTVRDENKNVVKKIQQQWDILDLIDSKQKITVIEELWAQCKHDAEATNREPILIFRRNGRGLCIAFGQEYLNYLTSFYGKNPQSIQINEIYICVMSLENFMEWIPDIRAALK
jgi:hypothetical protein